MTDTMTNTGQDLITQVNAQLEEWRKKGAHIITTITLQNIPPLHRPVVEAVFINPDVKAKEVYPQSGQLALSGIGWKRLADGMGLNVDASRSGRVDNGMDPNRCEYRVVGFSKKQDGTWRQLIGDKEIRMENIIEELYQSKRAAVKKMELEGGNDWKSLTRAFPDPEVWVQETVRKEALQVKKHILGRAQSGAFARMVKSIGIRETYTAAELQKPFVFLKLVFTPDPNHEGDRAFLRAQAAGAMDQLYPAARPATPALDAPPIDTTLRSLDYYEVPAIEHQPTPAQMAPPAAQAGQPTQPASHAGQAPQAGSPAQESAPPDPDEVLRHDFKASDAKGQKAILEQLIRRKNYQGKLQGDLTDWKPEHRAGFFDKLMAMADAPTQTTAKFTDELPFE